MACDALISPVVTGEVDPGALDGLVRLCVELSRWDNPDPGDSGREQADPADPAAAPSCLSREALERAIIGKAVELLSGPGGLASFLRRQQLGAPLAGPSLPLDIGYSDTVPAAIRHAVTLRDRTAGGPAAAPSPPPPARSTTSATRPTAAPPASKTASCCVFSTIRSSSTAGAGPWS